MNGGLYCASQALSPIVIRLGARTGGSVCLGLQPSHVVAARSPPIPTPTPSLRVALSGSAVIEKPKSRTERLLGLFFRTCSAIPTLSKARSGQNRQSVFLGRLLERFAERREDAGPRGGRRQTKHQGRVDTEVAEVGGGTCLVAGHHLL